jgi:hypothetical protein
VTERPSSNLRTRGQSVLACEPEVNAAVHFVGSALMTSGCWSDVVNKLIVKSNRTELDVAAIEPAQKTCTFEWSNLLEQGSNRPIHLHQFEGLAVAIHLHVEA